MAEAKPVQPSADRPAMHAHAMHGGQFGHDLVQCQIALDRQPFPQPAAIGRQFTLGMVALRLGQQAPARALEDHHVVHEPRRHPEVPRRLTMPVAFLNKSNDPTAQLDRMWLAHYDPQYLAGSGNHKPLNLEILNQM